MCAPDAAAPGPSERVLLSLREWVARLAQTRPAFHSEADFQHSLAMIIREVQPELLVRLETRPEAGMHQDMLVSWPATRLHLAAELKYLTSSWAGEIGDERLSLSSQAAHDIRGYDVIKDIARVESLVAARPGWGGAVVVISNDASHWQRPGHGRATNADAFRLYEGSELHGLREWGPNTGEGTKRGRSEALHIRGTYACHWEEYSHFEGPGGRFRVLLLTTLGATTGVGVDLMWNGLSR